MSIRSLQGPNRIRRSFVAVLAAAALGAVACVPEPSGPGGGPPPGQCPHRTTKVLERVHQRRAPVPRDFSADGRWMVMTYLTPDDEVELTLQELDSSAGRVPVARLVPFEREDRSSGPLHWQHLAVTDGGDVTMIAQPKGEESGVWTWDRASGELVRQPDPSVDPPAGHQLEWILPERFSEDGTRTVWRERTIDPHGETASRTVLVATASGEVLGVTAGSPPVSNDAMLAVATSRDADGHPVDEVVDLLTGERQEVTGVGEALLAAQPDWHEADWWIPGVHVSDGGRYVAYWARAWYAEGGPFGVTRTKFYVWDRVEQALRLAPLNPSEGSVDLRAIAEDGRILLTRTTIGLPAPLASFLEFDPSTGRVTTIDSEHMSFQHEIPMPSFGDGFPVTGDLRTFGTTLVPWLTAPTAEVRISRCT